MKKEWPSLILLKIQVSQWRLEILIILLKHVAIHRVLVKGIDNAGCWPVAGVKCSGRGAGGAGRGTGLAPPRE